MRNLYFEVNDPYNYSSAHSYIMLNEFHNSYLFKFNWIDISTVNTSQHNLYMFNSDVDALNFCKTSNYDVEMNKLAAAFPNFLIYTYDYANSGIITKIVEVVNGIIAYNNSILQTNQASVQQVDAFTPGESLKKYRKGEAIDWEELAKKYGAECQIHDIISSAFFGTVL